MKKKILIVGNSASAYALAKKLSEKHDVYVTSLNPACKDFAELVDIREDNINELLEFAMENSIDMTIPISQKSIIADISDRFTKNKQAVFAPTAKAGELTFNKVLAKKTLYKLRINTPKFGIFEKLNLAYEYLKNQKKPFVIKTNDSNSAVVLTSENIAKNILDSIFTEKNKRVIIEDYIYGTPFSFYTITDGYKALPIGSSITYKYSLEGNGGQLTDGMGSCVPNYKLSTENIYCLMDNIIYPTLEELEVSGKPYTGILGVNGIITDNGEIYILGWNSFMQNSDAAAIIDSIDDDLYNLFDSCIVGSFSDEIENINTNDSYYASVVLNCINKENVNNIITGLDNLDESTILTYYPNVTKNKYLEYEALNGPVIAVTQKAATVSKAVEHTYNDVKEVNFNGLNYRKDICK